MDTIRKWLREDIGVPIEDGQDMGMLFANGVAFARILHHYGLQPDLAEFTSGHSPEVQRRNFQRLHATFLSLNIPFGPRLAHQIMTQEPGAAEAVVHRLK
eukprot:2728950-Rhodomonas_salina.1